MRTNKLKRSEKKRLKEEEKESNALREREVARTPERTGLHRDGSLYIDLCQSDRISDLF